jgi:hypothetical protein
VAQKLRTFLIPIEVCGNYGLIHSLFVFISRAALECQQSLESKQHTTSTSSGLEVVFGCTQRGPFSTPSLKHPNLCAQNEALSSQAVRTGSRVSGALFPPFTQNLILMTAEEKNTTFIRNNRPYRTAGYPTPPNNTSLAVRRGTILMLHIFILCHFDLITFLPDRVWYSYKQGTCR